MTDVKELLRGVAIFKDLEDEELQQIAEVCKPEDFVSGEYIFREGESGNRLYLARRSLDGGDDLVLVAEDRRAIASRQQTAPVVLTPHNIHSQPAQGASSALPFALGAH